MPREHQGQAREPTKSAMHQLAGHRSAQVPGWLVALAAGGRACQHRPARSLHPGRGGRTRLPPRGLLAVRPRLSRLSSRPLAGGARLCAVGRAGRGDRLLHPSGAAARHRRARRRRDGCGPHRVLDRAGAGCHLAQGVRQPAGVGVPIVLGDLPGRQLPAPGRRPPRRQGRPRDRGRPSAAVRHLHRTIVRPGPLPQGPRAAGVSLPSLPARPTLPAWRPGRLLAAPRRRRPRLGEPLCARCYQTGAQVLWNALAGRLWSRTTIYLHRALARLAGVTEAELRGAMPISFAKVAEYQKRGAVRFHAIIRLDAATDSGCPAGVAPPPTGFTAELLERAVRQAAATVAVPCPAADADQAVTLVARWGEQLDVHHDHRGRRAGSCRAEQVAGYVAKYATRAPRPWASRWIIVSVRLSLRVWMSRPMRLSWCGPAGSWAAALGLGGCGCASGRTCSLRRPPLDQEPPLLDHPGCPASGPGRLRHPPPPWQHPAAGCLGPTRGRPGRDRRRLLALPRLGLPERRGRRGWPPRRPLGRGNRDGSPRRNCAPRP